MSKTKTSDKVESLFAAIAIPVLLVAAVIIYMFVLGDKANFVGGDPANHPVEDGIRHVLGLVYKGGFIVPILLALVLINITFSIERLLTVTKAKGKGSNQIFVRKIKQLLDSNAIDEAISQCDKQRGSLANVVKSALIKYKTIEHDNTIDKEGKILSVQKEIEEATSLELPMLEKNLVIISTLASVSTLVALLGTVLGMIKAFSALASAGSPDSVALANGISEALINTALGIANSALAIILYNFFTTSIDKITYAIDEAGFSITQTFAASTHNISKA